MNPRWALTVGQELDFWFMVFHIEAVYHTVIRRI